MKLKTYLSRSQVRSVRCRSCGAAQGAFCVMGGHTDYNSHNVRIRDAEASIPPEQSLKRKPSEEEQVLSTEQV